MSEKEMILKHIEEIDKELKRNLGNSHNSELLKAKSLALIALSNYKAV
ncbi:hypothetical protein V7128_02055 [Neobacillus vireti]